MNVWPAVLAVFIATDANAACSRGQQVFSSCEIDGQNTEVFVCFDKNIAIYTYGRIGEKPELTLSQTIKKLDFVPWSGMGRSIAESVIFHDGDFSYELVGGFSRRFNDEENQDENSDPEAATRSFGWLDIARDGKPLKRLECVSKTVTYAFGEGIYDLKVAAGLKWDDRSKRWLKNTN